MKNNVKKVLTLALVFVMVFASLGNVGLAFNNTSPVLQQDLVNRYYGQDTGAITADDGNGCETTMAYQIKVVDNKGNLLGYHIEQKTFNEIISSHFLPDEEDADLKDAIDAYVNNLLKLGFINVRVQDEHVFAVYAVDASGNIVNDPVAWGVPNEFGIATFFYSDDEGPKAFPPGSYVIVHHEEPELNGQGKRTTVGRFDVTACGGATGTETVTLTAPKWCFTLRTVEEGMRPAIEKEVDLVTLQTVKSGAAYKYQLKEDKTYRAGKTLGTVKTNRDGYAELFNLVPSMVADPEDATKMIPEKDAQGFELYNVIMPGVAEPVGQIRKGEFLGATPDGGETVYVINPWKIADLGVERAWLRDPAIWPTFDYVLNCGQTVMIPYGTPKATLRVRVFHADEEWATRLPVPGAVVALHKNGSQIWGPITAGEELARGTTDENGIVEFRNVPLSDVMKYFGPVTNNAYLQSLISTLEHLNADDIHWLYGGTPVIDLNELLMEGSTVALPYLIKQVSAPAGFYFDDELYPALVQKHDLNKTKFVEIRNFKDNISRLAGDDRYETAIAVANKNYPNGPILMNDNYKTVILADGHNFADALVGGVLASQYDAPLLLTEKAKLTESTKAYIDGHNVNRVVVLGGEYSVTPAVWKDLVDMGIHVERVNGATRAATAVKVGENVIKLLNDGNEVKFNKGFTHNGRVFLAYEGDFADALTASVPASEFGTPILLTATNKLSPETKEALEKWNVREVIIVGGPNSVSEAVAEEVRAVGNITVGRYYGLNRATTAMEIAKHFYHQTTFAYVANGHIWADALTGAPLAAKESAPILLVEKDKVPDEVAEYIKASLITQVEILGGPNTVSEAVRAQLNALMVPASPGIEVSN